MMTNLELRIATINVSGGEKTFETVEHDTRKSRQEALLMLVSRLNADVLCLQEVAQYIDADGVTHNIIEEISQTSDYEDIFYGKTIAMETHMQVKKKEMVEGIFNDWWNWCKGNAILSRLPFARLSDPSKSGVPRNIPLYRPISYEGNRDSDPRYTLLSRLKEAPFPFISTLHLTTLIGERPPAARPEKIEQARLMRYQQMNRFMDLVRQHILDEGLPLIVAGDFNATPDEIAITRLLESENGFIHLRPENMGRTHFDMNQAVDHIFFYPRERLVDYQCWIESSDLSKRASDHLPVVADLQIK